MPARSFSMSAAAPNPLMTTLAPARAKARAHANPMPLVEPVTTAALPVNVPIPVVLLAMDGMRGRASCSNRVIRRTPAMAPQRFASLHGDRDSAHGGRQFHADLDALQLENHALCILQLHT